MLIRFQILGVEVHSIQFVGKFKFFQQPDDPACTGADCSPPPIGCVGVECFDPEFENNPVRTLWSQDGIE